MSNQRTDEAMKIVYKGYTDLTQRMIEHIFNNPTETSYLINQTRWYVSKYNAGHFIHYYFQYTASTVNVKIKILPHSKQPEQS